MDREEVDGLAPPGEKPIRKQRARGLPRTESQLKAQEIRASQLKQTGKPLPGCPMTPEELCEQWSIGQGDAMTVTVKVLRQAIGRDDRDLVDSVPLVDFDGRRIAANFGPGRYYLRPAAGQYAKCAATLPISEEMARNCGWGKLPVTPQDAVAERTIRNAAEAPTDPLELLAAVQQVVRRELAAAGVGVPSQGVGQAMLINPMEAMRTQMEQMTSWMGFMDTMEKKMQDRVERRMGIEREEKEPSSVWEKLIPVAATLFERLTAGQPAPIAQVQILPATTPQSEPEKKLETPAMPNLLPEEKAAIGRAVAMLRPFGSQLVELGNSQATDEQIVQELEGYIPDSMVESIGALASVVKAHGKEVLFAIHPGIATDRWAGILPKLVGVLNE